MSSAGLKRRANACGIRENIDSHNEGEDNTSCSSFSLATDTINTSELDENRCSHPLSSKSTVSTPNHPTFFSFSTHAKVSIPKHSGIFVSPASTPTDDTACPLSVWSASEIDQETRFSAPSCLSVPKRPRSESVVHDGRSRATLAPTAFALPLVPRHRAQHGDLPSISVETAFRLIAGEFKATVGSFTIIDCRFPFEYEGGHLPSAKNIYEPFMMHEELFVSPPSPQLPCELFATEPVEGTAAKAHRASSLSTVTSDADLLCIENSMDPYELELSQRVMPPVAAKRHILLFHCEFSHSRGPSMMRAVRNYDRDLHRSVYPKVAYPEIYLIEKGYSAFFANYAPSCAPSLYRKMLDAGYTAECTRYKKEVQAQYQRFTQKQKLQARRGIAAPPRPTDDDEAEEFLCLSSIRTLSSPLFEAADTMLSPSNCLSRLFADLEVKIDLEDPRTSF